MDERKKKINELEQRKKEQSILLDSLLMGLGETLLGRIDDSSDVDANSFAELAAYRRFKDDIATSESSIKDVEEQIRRFRELEENIESREREESVCIKDLGVMYGSLGKLLLDAVSSQDGAMYAEFCAPWREQAEALLTKVLSLEDRITGLEQKEGGNVFTWIGKGAQTLVLRSFLTKAQENLEQLRRNIGESYCRRDAGNLPDSASLDNLSPETAEIVGLRAMIERKRAEHLDVSQILQTLREERKKISASYSAEGGPLKYIQNLRNHIGNIRNEMRSLYRRVGADAAAAQALTVDGLAEDAQTERRLLVGAFVGPDDQETLESAAAARASIRDAETEIEKLKASIAIDDERAKIDKFRKQIQDRKDKIAQAERSIVEFEAGIRDCESSIEKLKKLL